MKALRDPERAQVRALVAACPLADKRILEIGCGSGQLTWQYAGIPRQVVGIDPEAAALDQAKIDRPASISNVSLLRAVCEALPFPSHVFDVALFASSF
jgi:ubiquinone/menaquinone biosynthesis C-methylase UbiE